jgi:hypothetical protein
MLLGVKGGFHDYLDPSHDPMAVSSEDDFPIDHVVRVWGYLKEIIESHRGSAQGQNT